MATQHPAPGPDPVADTAAIETSTEITRTDCRRCGTEVYGIEGRYACPLCGWVNPWSEGHNSLPTAEEDPDYPKKK